MIKQVLICNNQPRTRFYTAKNDSFVEIFKRPVVPFRCLVDAKIDQRSKLPPELVEKILMVLIDGYMLDGYFEMALHLILSSKILLCHYYKFFDEVPYRPVFSRNNEPIMQPSYLKMITNLSRGFKLIREIIVKMETPLDHFMDRDSVGRYETIEEVKVISLESIARNKRVLRIWDLKVVESHHENCELFMPAVRPDGRAFKVAPTNNQFDGLVYYTFTHARAHVYYNVKMIRPLIVLCIAPVNVTLGRTLHEKSWMMLEELMMNLYWQNSDGACPQLRFIDRRDRALDLQTYITKTKTPAVPTSMFY